LAPPEQVDAFEAEMRAAQVRDWQLISYGTPGVIATCRIPDAAWCVRR